jgi:PAS domain S-box-containing protein
MEPVENIPDHRQVEPLGEAWTRAIVEAAVDGIMTIDDKGIILYCNSAAERLFGYRAEEILGKNISMLMPSPYAEQHDEYLARYLRSGHATIVGIIREVVGLRKNGTEFPMELSVSEVHMGERRLFTGVLHDITRRKKAQEEKDLLLRELNKRNIEMTCMYRIEESIRSQDVLDGIFADAVEFIRQAFFEPEAMAARIVFDDTAFTSEGFNETAWRLQAPIVVNGRRRGCIEVFYLDTPDTEDEEPFLKEEADLIEAIGSVFGEKIERQEAEAQVIHASKLASIGELAAGVSHEINNPINSIMNCADILIKDTEPHSRQNQFARLIQSEAIRITNIVKSLLTFSRQDSEFKRPVQLHTIVEGVLSLSRKKFSKSNVDLQIQIPGDLPELYCSSEQMQQVLMNLMINALHALDEKYPEAHDNKLLSVVAQKISFNGSDGIRLTVEDHGTGIAPAHRDRLFDPFFTTKGRDKGTGLGLSVSDGIVRSHGGTIRVESELGEFTRFHVDLPLLHAETKR